MIFLTDYLTFCAPKWDEQTMTGGGYYAKLNLTSLLLVISALCTKSLSVKFSLVEKALRTFQDSSLRLYSALFTPVARDIKPNKKWEHILYTKFAVKK